MGFFSSSRPAISAKALLRFPARVLANAGLKVERAFGAYTFSLDFPSLADNLGVADPSKYTTLILNKQTGVYEEIRLDTLPPPTNTDTRTARGDANYQILNTDRYVALTAPLTANRTWTLPAANSVPPGASISTQDEVGGIGAFTLTIVPTGADTINGAASLVLTTPLDGRRLRSDGVSRWTWSVLSNKSVTDAKLRDSTALSVIGRSGNTLGVPADVTAANDGEVLRRAGAVLGFGRVGTLGLDDGAVTTAKQAEDGTTNTKLANVPTGTVKGRVTAGTGDPEDLTGSQVRDGIVPAGFVIDRVYAEYTANASLTASIPGDDTIPQNNEGTQIISATITPKSATNRVRARFQGCGSASAVANVIAALFAGGVSAVRSIIVYVNTTDGMQAFVLEYEHVPGVTTPVTYTVRVGATAGQSVRFNGFSSGRLLGGSMGATLTLEELKG